MRRFIEWGRTHRYLHTPHLNPLPPFPPSPPPTLPTIQEKTPTTYRVSRKKLSLATCSVWYCTFRVGGAAAAAAVPTAVPTAVAVVVAVAAPPAPASAPVVAIPARPSIGRSVNQSTHARAHNGTGAPVVVDRMGSQQQAAGRAHSVRPRWGRPPFLLPRACACGGCPLLLPLSVP